MPDENTKALIDEMQFLRKAIGLNTAHVKMLTEKLDRLKDVKI